ncbi:MAG: CHAT domain-containing protein [Pirellulales bacterium]|nr:CHAT domain-containing protein [Pirellulales bacterium]
MPHPSDRLGADRAVPPAASVARLGGRFVLAAMLCLGGFRAALWADPPVPGRQGPPDATAAARPTLDPRYLELERLEADVQRLEREDQLDEALEVALKLLALGREIHQGKPHREIAASCDYLVRLYEQTGDFDHARRYADEQIKLVEAIYGRQGWRLAEARRRRALVDRRAAMDPDERWQLFNARRQADRLAKEDRFNEALPLARQAAEIEIQRLKEGDYYAILALRRTAELSLQAGQLEQVERTLKACLRDLERLVGRDHPSIGDTLDLLAGYHRAQRDYEAALPLHREAAENFRRVYDADDPQMAVALNNLAVSYDELQFYDEAVPRYREALRIMRLRHADNYHDVRSIRENLARVLVNQGDVAFAEEDYTAAIKLFSEAEQERSLCAGPDHWQTIDARRAVLRARRLLAMSEKQRAQYRAAVEAYDQASLLGSEGKPAEALAAAEKALESFRELFGEEDRWIPNCLNEMANHLSSLERYDESRARYDEAGILIRRLLGENHFEIGINLYNMGNLLERMGQNDQAIEKYREVVDLQAKILGKTDPEYADSLRVLGYSYRDRGDYQLAEPLLQEAVDILRPAQAEYPAYYTNAVYDLAALYRLRGEYGRAEPLLREAMLNSVQVFGEESHETALYTNQLAIIYDEQQKHAEASELYQRAIELHTALEGRDSSNVATTLDNLGRLYAEDRKYELAEPLLAEALAIRVRLLGRNHADVHASLAHLAGLYLDQQNYQDAEPLLVEAAEVCRKTNGPTSPLYAERLIALASLYDSTSRAALAAQQRQGALDAIEQGLADEDKQRLQRHLNDFVSTLDNLANQFQQHDDFTPAIRARRLRWDAVERLFGQDHWRTTNARFDLAELQQTADMPAADRTELTEASNLMTAASDAESKGQFQEAAELTTQALEIRRRLLGDDNRYTIVSLSSLGSLHRKLGDYEHARAEAEEALARRRKLLGEGHPDVTIDMSFLGILCRKMGDFERTKELYHAVLERDLATHGETSTQVASDMNNLAVLYEDMGRPSQALPFARHSVEIHTQLNGEQHVDTLNAINTLAAVYLAMGDTERAVPLFGRIMRLYRELLGPEHPDYLESLNTAAIVCSDNSAYDMAEDFFRQALEGRAKVLGKDHPDYASTLNGFANMHWRQNKLDQAAAEHAEVLAIRQRRLGPRHTLTAQTQSSLARVYIEMARYDEAEKLLQAALETRRAVLEPTSPHIASTLYGLAILYLTTDRPQEALAALEESISLDQRQLEGIAAFASEPSLREFLRSIGYKYDRLMALAATRPDDPAMTRAALTWTLRRKSVILDTLCEYRAAESVFRHDPRIAGQLDQVKQLRQQATDLALSPPPGMTLDEVSKKQLALRDQARDIEENIREELNRRRLHQEKTEVTIQSVRASLPPGSALVEYIRFPTYVYQGPSANRELGDHYGAFVIAPGSTDAQFVDLGPAEAIDEAVSRMRQSIEDAPRELQLSSEADLEADYAEVGRHLAELIFDPLRPALGKAQEIFIAPDRELNRVPFAALVADSGQYLLENFDIAYLSCGRDLLRDFPRSGEGTLVFAGPDYDLATPARKERAEEVLAAVDEPLEIQLAERSAPVDVDLRALRWNRLPGAEGEANDVDTALVGSTYAPVSLYVGPNALEDVFKAVHSPRILHIATHGFFLTASEQGPGSIERGPGESAEIGAGAAGGIARLRLNANPLLRSGIVLAGANDLATDPAAAASIEDGWVTAEEISLLDFRGTELVVLSACESGLGDIDTRDGVYGLRRAFFHAGAHNLLTSLFKVPDVETRRLMAAFYRSLAQGQTKLAALHAAQRKILADRRAEGQAAHPFFWASFILVGEGE